MLVFNTQLARIIMAAALAVGWTAAVFAQDPPSRVARLNYVSGNVSMQPAGLDDWTAAELNRPFTTGDTLYTDFGSRAELHLDSAVLRVGENTNFGFLTLNDQIVQLRLTEGDLSITLRDLDMGQTFEVDSPNASVTLQRPGVYRFRIAGDGSLSFVVVRQGTVEIMGAGQEFSVTPGNSASITGGSAIAYDIGLAPDPDDFDIWCRQRDDREAHLASLRYLLRNVVGYEDLDSYGNWQELPSYGPVWYPRAVDVGWSPYHYGHWAWIEPWGWTWVDDAPWGFAPFHYGRWAFIAGRWGWCPGPIVVVANRPQPIRPIYSPALVAWFGGAHFGVAVHVGGGASLGWVALGFGEVYTPSYHCSPHYFERVNVSNTTVVKTVNITNVYNTVYVNKTVYVQNYTNVQAPHAVMAMQQNDFASGRPVRQAALAVEPHQMQQIRTENVAVMAPAVAPTRQALLAATPRAQTARPPAAITQRQVVVQNRPAAPPAPFAARQAYLQGHAGQLHDPQAMHQQVAQNMTPPQPRYVVSSAAKPMSAPQTPPVGPQRKPEPHPQPMPEPRAQPLPQPRAQPMSHSGGPPNHPPQRNAYPDREHQTKPTQPAERKAEEKKERR